MKKGLFMPFRLLYFFRNPGYLFLVLISFSLYVNAQHHLVKNWDKRFGGNDWDVLYSMQPTRDGGYVLGGTSYSGVGGDKTQPSRGDYDYWVIKIDSSGA